MKKTTKHILGIAGLALVTAMTAVACALPRPDASAESGSPDVNVKITVKQGQDPNPQPDPDAVVRIHNPEDGAVFTNPSVPASVYYEAAETITYVLDYTSPDGLTTNTFTLPTFNPTSDSGTHNSFIDLDSYGGYGTYVLRTTATGHTVAEDAVRFVYRPLDGGLKGFDDEDGNPIVEFEFGEVVCAVHIQVYNKLNLNNPLFDPEIIYAPDPRPTGKVTFKIPFDEYGLPAGDYHVVLTPYDCSEDGGQPIEPALEFDIDGYKPVTAPEVPNTGGGIFAGLNLSRTDYLVSGLMVFGLVAIFAFILLGKKKDGKRR